jgi:hypothetical protein
MSYKISELKGLKSVEAATAFFRILLGYYSLYYILERDKNFEKYEDFLKYFFSSGEDKQKEILLNSFKHAEANKDDISILISFALDTNGIPFSEVNTSGLNPLEILNIAVAVCMVMIKIPIFTVKTENEKKN